MFYIIINRSWQKNNQSAHYTRIGLWSNLSGIGGFGYDVTHSTHTKFQDLWGILLTWHNIASDCLDHVLSHLHPWSSQYSHNIDLGSFALLNSLHRSLTCELMLGFIKNERPGDNELYRHKGVTLKGWTGGTDPYHSWSLLVFSVLCTLCSVHLWEAKVNFNRHFLSKDRILNCCQL